MDISQLLAFSVKNKASDLHLSSGLPPMIRVHGDIKRINLPAMEHKDVHGMIYDIMNDGQRKFYEENLECDFSFAIPGLARFRVNAFVQNRGAAAVNLEGWSLSNDRDEEGQWIFPSVNLPANGFLIVWASGKDRRPTTAGARLHTTVKLNGTGDSLRDNADVREFYLGLSTGAGHTSMKDVKHYKRRKRWLS
jgi:twitching motility protein PilT